MPDLVQAAFFLALGATVGGRAARRLGQPAVLGELLAGILLGPAALGWLDIGDGAALEQLGELGIVAFLFIVGVETDAGELARVGRSATLVATLGAVGSFGLGMVAGLVLGDGGIEAAFIGGVLTATSVGVTAQVLGERGLLKTDMGRTVLGAAVVDDVLGLVLLAVLAGTAEGDGVTAGSIALLGARLIAFLVLVAIAARVVERVLASPRHRIGAAVVAVVAAGITGVAGAVGLAYIVGAFAAGLILPSPGGHDPMEGSLESEGIEEAAVEPPSLRLHHRSHRSMAPVVRVAEGAAIRFAPIFFVTVGADVAPGNGWSAELIGIAGALLVLGMLGKLVSGLGAPSGSRLAVGVAMVPRGEVGLVFAAAGLQAGVLSDSRYGALVLAVAGTTLIGPFLLSRIKVSAPDG